MSKIEELIYFFSPLSNFTFSLTHKEIPYVVSLNQNGTFNVKENIDFSSVWYENISIEHTMMQQLKYSVTFQKTMQAIKQYEQKMRERMKVDQVKVEGKINTYTFVVSFQLKSPVLAKTNVLIHHDEKEEMTYVPLRSILYLAIEKNGNVFTSTDMIKIIKPPLALHSTTTSSFNLGNFEYYKNFDRSFFTHRTFLEDLCALVVKDKRARVKLLVN